MVKIGIAKTMQARQLALTLHEEKSEAKFLGLSHGNILYTLVHLSRCVHAKRP